MHNLLMTTRANIMLFLTALIWGATFVAQKTAMDNLGPFMFNGARFLIGTLSLLLISFFIHDKQKRKKRRLVEGGLLAGVLLFMAATLQQVGIVTSSAGHTGFITSLYIVMVPLFTLISGKKIEKTVWFGIILAIIGLYCLCVKDDFLITKGDLSVLFSAVFFAFHIMCIAKYAKKNDAIKLSCLQFLFAAIFSFMLAFLFEKTQISDVLKCGEELFYTGVLSCAAAFTFQICAQKYTKPYVASLILSLESVFAVLAAFVFLHEVLMPKEILGCVLMLSAVFIAQYHKNNN